MMEHDDMQISDFSSELSSPPSTLHMDLDIQEPTPFGDFNDAQPQETALGVSTASRTPFERLPIELIEKIAINLSSDSGIRNLALTSTYFAATILSSRSGVWRARFLSFYDYPIIEHPDQFRFAYQIRRLTTRSFVSFGHGVNEQGLECLETLKDMVMEAYHTTKPPSSNPARSKNLNLFAQPAPYIDKFLSQPLCTSQQSKYGEPHDFFDALQLCLSYVMLAPRSYAAIKSSSRGNYDAQRVYKFDHRFQTIYHIPEVQRSLQPVLLPRQKLTLSLHDLLHIRNFWNRHLSSVDENAYFHMASKLDEMGRGPLAWTSPFKPVGDDFVLPKRWIGHYSCVHSFPRRMSDLQYGVQTCAEDWGTVDPLTLDTVSSAKQADWFPQIFADIPGLRRTLPDLSQSAQKLSPSTPQKDPIKFIRGVAPFIVPISSGKDSSADANKKMKDENVRKILNETDLVPGLTLADVSKPNISPYSGLRVRGLAYPIKAKNLGNSSSNDSINQLLDLFTRTVFVLYKPTDLYLLATAENWKYVQDTRALLLPHQLGLAGASSSHSTNEGNGIDNTPGDSVQLKTASLQKPTTTRSKKTKKLKAPEESKPLPDRSLVINQEDAYHQSTQTPLNWDDVEYAYAYEGSILPGGKIMMGRWWRCDPWIAREAGLPVPAGLFEPIDEVEIEEDGWTVDDAPLGPQAIDQSVAQAEPVPENGAAEVETVILHSFGLSTVQVNPFPEVNIAGVDAVASSHEHPPTANAGLPAASNQTSSPPTLIWQTAGPLQSGAPVSELSAAQVAMLQQDAQTTLQNLQAVPGIYNGVGGIGSGSGAQEVSGAHNGDGNGDGDGDGGGGEEVNGNGNENEPEPLQAIPNANTDHPLAAIWDEDAVPRGERGPFIFWVDSKGAK